MNKLRGFIKKKSQSDSTHHRRITNETVAEHRESVLAGGRRFKYPVQYARHRLIFNAIAISIVALVVLIVVIWWQLYPSQNTTTFFYRITRVLPIPVAIVDGEQVRYSDYLVGFRSQEHYLQNKEGINLYSEEFKQQLEYIKRNAMDDAISDAYASKLARENSVTVSDAQVDDALKRQRESRDGITSQETYDAIVLDHFNWTSVEAREVTAKKLLRQEVSYHIDKTAMSQRDQVVKLLGQDKDFNEIVKLIKVVGEAKVTTGATPLVPSNNQDGGLASTAVGLSKGGVSKPFRSTTGDGYYVVKLLEKDDDNRVSYAFLKVPLTEFDSRLKSIKSNKGITEFIDVPQIAVTLTRR